MLCRVRRQRSVTITKLGESCSDGFGAPQNPRTPPGFYQAFLLWDRKSTALKATLLFHNEETESWGLSACGQLRQGKAWAGAQNVGCDSCVFPMALTHQHVPRGGFSGLFLAVCPGAVTLNDLCLTGVSALSPPTPRSSGTHQGCPGSMEKGGGRQRVVHQSSSSGLALP